MALYRTSARIILVGLCVQEAKLYLNACWKPSTFNHPLVPSSSTLYHQERYQRCQIPEIIFAWANTPYYFMRSLQMAFGVSHGAHVNRRNASRLACSPQPHLCSDIKHQFISFVCLLSYLLVIQNTFSLIFLCIAFLVTGSGSCRQLSVAAYIIHDEYLHGSLYSFFLPALLSSFSWTW